MNNKTSKIFILSGPSGAGEDSIIEGLKKIFPIERIMTTTTREMRPGESEGHPYYFISKEDFRAGIERGNFFEWAEEDRGNFYGVTKKEIERVLLLDKIIIWKLDYKGVINARQLYPEAISILIDVPLEVIEKRIRLRDNATDEYVQERLAYANGWYENRDKFNYSIKNEDGRLDKAIEETVAIIRKNINEESA
jgi:guanylate kinase